MTGLPRAMASAMPKPKPSDRCREMYASAHAEQIDQLGMCEIVLDEHPVDRCHCGPEPSGNVGVKVEVEDLDDQAAPAIGRGGERTSEGLDHGSRVLAGHCRIHVEAEQEDDLVLGEAEVLRRLPGPLQVRNDGRHHVHGPRGDPPETGLNEARRHPDLVDPVHLGDEPLGKGGKLPVPDADGVGVATGGPEQVLADDRELVDVEHPEVDGMAPVVGQVAEDVGNPPIVEGRPAMDGPDTEIEAGIVQGDGEPSGCLGEAGGGGPVAEDVDTWCLPGRLGSDGVRREVPGSATGSRTRIRRWWRSAVG